MSLFAGEALYRREDLERLDQQFLAGLQDALREELLSARARPEDRTAAQESALMIALAPWLEDFLVEGFQIGAAAAEGKSEQAALAPLYACKRQFVQRRAAKAAPLITSDNGAGLKAEMAARLGGSLAELDFAKAVLAWMADDKTHAEDLALAARYAVWRVEQERQAAHSTSVLFRLPQKRDPLHRVPVEGVDQAGVPALALSAEHQRERRGFNLTDPGCDRAGGLDHVAYCILCHHQGKDSCSKGLPDKARPGSVAKNAVGVSLHGCPLEEKISEMHEVKGQGLALAALAVAVVDNPMVAGTGHRICNDCMAACIYQGQNRDPVDIPQAETRILKDVLELPFGFEVYSLLTRWNPLNIRRPLPRPSSGRKVLVVGVGPAGFTLAHHLMQDGHAVVAVDGLKIEPLPASLSGVDEAGERVAFDLIQDIRTLWAPLGRRVSAGFGGVAEYGITVRWDKNYLTVIRLLLERRREFALFGGVRFGGTLSLEQAFSLGFDHVALATGAGRPTILPLRDGLARGVRQASDFLMALQLTGAARADTVANLQMRLPVVVIGGGLTAIDTCTEALAYYPIQVEKFLSRHEALVAERGEASVRAAWNDEDREVAEEFLAHGKALRQAPDGAARRALLNEWGSAMIAYRRRLIDSPAYRNHEEVTKALEEGIFFAEQLTPVAVEIDGRGRAAGLRVRDETNAERVLPARTILVAAGTVPNTTLSQEDSRVGLEGKFFQAVDESGNKVSPERTSKPTQAQVLMEVEGFPAGSVSFFGDLHPSYAGNVVSAMASAKQGHPVVTRALFSRPASKVSREALFATLNQSLRASVHAVRRLTPTIVEIVVRAPAAARAFQPGQFYRLQNYETHALQAEGTVLAMEGLALTGAWTDPEQGLVGLIVLEMGGSSDLCAVLQTGEPVVLMGPTGAATVLPSAETVLLAGGGLGNAVLFSIGAALRAAGSRVLYFAGYRSHQDRFKVSEIEAAADVVVWCVDSGEAFVPGRSQDKTFVGNIVAAMVAYAKGELGEGLVPLGEVDHLIAIGSDRMMAAVAAARHEALAPWLKPKHVAIGSINSPMQCMMKEICGQCLQRQVDPLSGKEVIVFTCSNQDQQLDEVDFAGLRERLGQNGVLEKQTRAWVDRSLRAIRKRS